MAWWSNYSGTYQPIAAFRAQAGLPEDKFVPWQKLQMGGVAMQRGTFSERRAPGPAAMPGVAADGKGSGSAARSGAVATEPKADIAGPRIGTTVAANRASTSGSKGSGS